MIISIIAAVDEDGGIDKNGKIPWHLPADMKHFRELTLGKPVIMGRKTFQSIGKPLPGRQNIIITRDKDFRTEGAEVALLPEETLAAAAPAEEVIVIGGAEVYRQFLPLADKIYLTRVKGRFECDTFFTEFNPAEWRESERVEHAADAKNPDAFAFSVFQKIR